MTGDITVDATSDTQRNATSGSATVGGNALLNTVVNAVSGLASLFSTKAASKKPSAETCGSAKEWGLSAGFVYADHTNNATAAIMGTEAVKSTAGSITVGATVKDKPSTGPSVRRSPLPKTPKRTP